MSRHKFGKPSEKAIRALMDDLEKQGHFQDLKALDGPVFTGTFCWPMTGPEGWELRDKLIREKFEKKRLS